ncbi:hypothetical protein LX66_3504 [Chitinophaga japonensis]|uniref:Lipoprotein n=2 Tax=Chitinophaga japonensis TaxID=104662 RepID=A0A562SY57_CHIJA|nr:hypothetical protein LX66_3504 [Chitinophaga japonensis]
MRSCFIRPAMLVLLILCFGCGHSPEQLVAYVENPSHGLVQEMHLPQYDIRIQYLPPDLQVLAAHGRVPSAAVLKEDRSKYEGFAYFRFVLQGNDFEPKADTLAYLDFNMMNDFMLVTGKGDTIPCVIYQRIASGSKHRTEFMVVFEGAVTGPGITAQDFRFVYADKILGIPPVVFRFRARDLKKIPHL